jgi:hypothetical protein
MHIDVVKHCFARAYRCWKHFYTVDNTVYIVDFEIEDDIEEPLEVALLMVVVFDDLRP